MEKSLSRSVSGKTPISSGAPLGIPPDPTVKPAHDGAQLSREDISRCISIWARVYRLSDEETEMQDLCMSSRLWVG
jgi:hypothetical protein